MKGTLRFLISERTGRPLNPDQQRERGGDPGVDAFVAPDDWHKGRPGRVNFVRGTPQDFHRLGVRLARMRSAAANIRLVRGA